MCMSPHEMSSARMEELVAYLEREAIDFPDEADFALARRDEYAKILKERVEAGTYDDDHTDRSGHATARQGRWEG